MAGIAQQLYAVSVISLRSQCRPRWVLPLFLLCCALTEIRLYNTQPHDVTELKLCNPFQILALFFRKVSYFAKESRNPVFMRVCGRFFVK